jgi:hypothetical protein
VGEVPGLGDRSDESGKWKREMRGTGQMMGMRWLKGEVESGGQVR